FRAMIPDSCTYLEDESVEIGGLHIYGSPITPWFFDWAFNRQRGEEIKTYWDKIPANTDILITHGPPHHMLDLTFRNVYAGCEELGKAVARIRPRLHLFGHIHEAYGQLSQNGTLYVNASVVDLSYQVVNPPVVIDWP
ncbi:MAG: metallophosphoesterase, partial [Bacteroidota bacterium]